MITFEHQIRFAQPTGMLPDGGLQFACAQGQSQSPVFFVGQLLSPRRTADLLLALSRVVASRFHLPPAMLARVLREADPVITCGAERMRWEGFSACCSAYARVDLSPKALDGALLGVGTTNVDLGPQARAALAKLGDNSCHLQVGSEALELSGPSGSVIERRVPLPLRWLKGFVEVQSVMAGMRLCFEVSAAEARRFLHSLPKGPSRGHAWVVPSAKGLRLSQLATRQSVALAGWQRLAVVSEILRHASRLRVYSHPAGSTGWELVLPDANFHLVLSPDCWRGFSGEGQLLTQLSSHPGEARLGETLDWSQVLTREQLERRTGLSASALDASLAGLGGRGQLGYDLSVSGYFRRHLPFDYEKLEALHPRLKAAQSLRVEWREEVAWVESGDTRYRVGWEGNQAHCNCPWYAQHQLQRGPCKHILAAHLDLEKS